MRARGKDEQFEELDATELAENLKSFYAEVRDKEGHRYSHSTLTGIRAGLNRHIKMPPFNRTFDIIRDTSFIQANHVFDGYVKANILEGNASVKHKPVISDGDWQKLMNSTELEPVTPKGLQNKVFVNIMTHFARRGREGLRELKKDSFVIRKDDAGLEYIAMARKNHQGLNIRDIEEHGIMAEQPNDPMCPLASFKLHLSKLHKNSDIFFCYPTENPKWTYQSETWYTQKQLGVNTIGGWMAKLSKDVELSQVYTNHCLQATVASKLAKAGVSDRSIISVTGHKNESSLKHYISAASASEKRHLSNILHGTEAQVVKKEEKSHDIEQPRGTEHHIQPHTEQHARQQYAIEQSHTQHATEQGVIGREPNYDLVFTNEDTGLPIRNATLNQSSAIFSGAVFNNVHMVVNNNFYC